MSPAPVGVVLALGIALAPPTSVRTLDGETLRARDFDGKVTVIAFWATWCAPCLEELPHLDALYQKHKDAGLVVIAASNDGPETRARVKSMVAQKKWRFPVTIDDGSLRARYSARSENPYLVVLDPTGKVAYEHAGYSKGDERKVADVVERLLAARK